MPLKSLTFNNIRKPWLYLLAGRQKAPFAPLIRNMLVIPGMPGAHLQSTEVEPITINQPIWFDIRDDEHALQLKDELATWLVTDEPVPLQFDDEPGRTYYAVVQNTIEDFQRIAKLQQGTIQFLCLDPYAYGPELTVDFPSDAVTLTNEGTADAEPVFELEVLEPVTFAMVSNGEEYNAIGRPIDTDAEPAEELTHIFEHSFTNFTGWAQVPSGESYDGPLGGLVDGSFAIGTGQWYVNNFGTNPNGWHGPSRITSFSESLQDFQVDYFVSQLNFTGEIGKVVLFLKDETGNVVASMGARDQTIATGYYNKVQFYLGNSERLIFDYQGFNNTQIWLRLIRKGQQYTAMAYQVAEDGTMFNKVTRTFDDRQNQYQMPIRQAAVYVATFKEYFATRMYVNRLKAYRVNDLSGNQIPYIAQPGDIITFDHVNDDLLINGEPRMDIKDFGGTYFKLRKGINQLAVHPSAFNASVRYMPRYS